MSDEKCDKCGHTFRGYPSWLEKREDVERALYEGWRQHWLDMWSRIGQQYYFDFVLLKMSENINAVVEELVNLRRLVVGDEKDKEK